MSKKITHEQAREILNKIYYHCKDIPRQEDLEQYFLQQEKQEKLLELYRELNNEILHTYDIFEALTNKEWAKFVNLQQQIKELENEVLKNIAIRDYVNEVFKNKK